MDRKNLVEELQRAFQREECEPDIEEVTGVEYKENTKSLLVNEQKTYDILKEPEKQEMTEEEIFGRLHEERRSKQPVKE